MHRRTMLLASLLAAGLAIHPASVSAVDIVSSRSAPDLTSVRAKIKAHDFQAAIAELTPMLAIHQHADIYNLLGFSLRKTGDLKQAGVFYAKALDFDPNHKGALEYQGEMFVQLGQMDKAQANLARLVRLCPQGCEERQDLEKAVAVASAAATPSQTN